jgi:putative nucleotidyltransferase with HDIG domain
VSSRSSLFIAVVVALGTASAGLAAAHWNLSNPGLFALFFVLCAATSLFRFVLPGLEGSQSVAYIFLIWGITRLEPGETILMGIASALVQSYWRCQKKPRPVQVLFNVSLIALCVGVSEWAFSSRFVQSLAPSTATRTLLASVAYYLVNTVCVATVIALTEARPVWGVWRSGYLWTFPHYVLGASLVVGAEALRNAIGIQAMLLLVPVIYLVYHSFQMHIAGLRQTIERAEMERQHAEATAGLHLRTIRALALAIESKDQTTAEHLHRVQTYAVELGKDFGLSAEEMEALRAAAILHDIGKIAVPEHIISKPAKLTPDEFRQMKIHPVVGADIIENIKFPFPVARLVRAHHEKWDGSGYPDGLKGEEIPLAARILTAVDCLDALASDRQYRKAMPLDKAISLIVAEAGRSFDPKVVEMLSKRYRELEHLARTTVEETSVQLSSRFDVQRGLAPDAGFAEGWDSQSGRSPVRSQKAALELSLIARVNDEITRLDCLDSTLHAIQALLRTLIPFDCIALYVKQDEKFPCIYAEGHCADLLSHLAVTPGIGVSGWVAANGRPLVNGNAQTEFGVVGEAPAGFDLNTGLAIALESEAGTFAVLTLYSRERDVFVVDHLRLLLAVQSSLSYYLRLNSSGLTRSGLEALQFSVREDSPLTVLSDVQPL